MAVAAPVAIGLMVASSVMEGVGQMRADNASASADKANAQAVDLQGAFQESAIRRKERAVSGEAVSALADNGVGIGTGSALDLLRQNAIGREMDVLTARYDAGSQSSALRARARQEKQAGKFALFGGILRAGAAALSGYSQLGSANAVSASGAAARAAQLPGGQALPIPSSFADPTRLGSPSYVPNPSPMLKY